MLKSVDMEILKPFSSMYTLRLRLRMYLAILNGVKISISTDMNVNNLTAVEKLKKKYLNKIMSRGAI